MNILNNIINFNNLTDVSSEKICEYCDCCGIVTSNDDDILNLECNCCNKENNNNINICINCVCKFKLIGFEQCKNKYPKIFKYINSLKNTTNGLKKHIYSKMDYDSLYKKINDYDDFNQEIYTYNTLNYNRTDIFEIEEYGLYIFNNFYCNDCVKEKCVFFCPLHNKMTIDKNKNNKEILDINTIELDSNKKYDPENDETSIYKCPYVHKILDISVYEV